MTWVMSQQISPIKLRYPSKQSYLIIYYTFYLIKISIFLFFNYFSLFTRYYYSLFLVFSLPFTTWPWQKKEKREAHSHNRSLSETATIVFHHLFSRDPDKRKKKEKPTVTIVDCERQPQLLTVWVQSHSHNYISLPFSMWPWQKKEKGETHRHNCWLCECCWSGNCSFIIFEYGIVEK